MTATLTTETTPPTNVNPSPKEATSAGSQTDQHDQTRLDTQRHSVVLVTNPETTPPTSEAPKPTSATSAGSQTDRFDHPAIGAHRSYVEPVTNSEGRDGDATISTATLTNRPSFTVPASGHPSNLTLVPSSLHMSAELLDDVERMRIANENRLRSLIGDETTVDADGIKRGRGAINPTDEDFNALLGLVKSMHCRSDVIYGDPTKVDRTLALPTPGLRPRTKAGEPPCCLEHGAVASLRRQLRRTPLGAWGLSIPGVGEKSFARLLASTGDPYLRSIVQDDDTIVRVPRTVSQLRSMCGYAGDDTGGAIKRRRGVQSNWSTAAKSRSWLIAVACMKAHGQYPNPYGQMYYDRKALTEGRVHARPCAQCGGAGKADAALGQPWRDGHRHADALRVAAKMLLRDMWREAKRLHEGD